MADVIYGMDRGDTEDDVTRGAVSPAQAVEVVIDDAVNLTKEEVIRYLKTIGERILKNDDPF